jgi:beta-lactamase regulating signal transducer with metallopeptidase domain
VDTAVRPKGRQPGGFTAWAVAISIWMTGAIVVFCYVLMGHFAVWRLYRTTRRIPDTWMEAAEQLTIAAGLNRALLIVESSAVSVPFALYLWRPIIVMPSAAGRWSRARMRAVLLHEFAHIKRNDLHIQGFAQLACVLYWFNPLVWFGAHQLRLERERACDDFVLLSGTSGADYATHLFEIARAGSAATAAPFAVGLAAYRSQLEQRLIAIVNPGIPRQSASILRRFAVALAMLLAALAADALQITAAAIQVPIGPVRISAPEIQRAGWGEPLPGGTQEKIHSAPTGSSAEGNSRPQQFRWAAKMDESQTVEVYLGRGSIEVLPSGDGTVRVQASTDDPRHSEIRAVPGSNGVKFCNIVTTAREPRNYCVTGPERSQIREDQPATKFVVYVPAGLHFAGSTVFGDITVAHPRADSDMATIDGNITLELAPEEGANFNGNVIAGAVDSDFPLSDNTPASPTGGRPAIRVPRIVHGIVGSGGPRLSAMVVNGDIGILRRPAE